MGKTKDKSIILTFTVIAVLMLAGMVLAGGLSTPGYYTITLPDGNQKFLTSLTTSGTTTMHIQGFLVCDQTGTCATVDANGRLSTKTVIMDIAGNDLDLAQRGTVHSATDHGVILAGLTSAGTYSLFTLRVDGALLTYGTISVGSPVIISGGTVTLGSYPLTANTPTVKTIASVSSVALAPNSSRKGLILVNASTTNWISVAFGTTSASLYYGITLAPNGGAFNMDSYSMNTGTVNAISSGSTTSLSIQEYQ